MTRSVTTRAPTRRAALAMFTLVGLSARPDETGALDGVVTSEDGKAIGGVTVKAQHVVRDTTTVVVSDRDGRYYFAALAGGTYSLYLAKPGYCSVWIRQVVVRPAQASRRDVTLPVDASCRPLKGPAKKPTL